MVHQVNWISSILHLTSINFLRILQTLPKNQTWFFWSTVFLIIWASCVLYKRTPQSQPRLIWHSIMICSGKSKPNHSWICICIRGWKVASLQDADADPVKIPTHPAGETLLSWWNSPVKLAGVTLWWKMHQLILSIIIISNLLICKYHCGIKLVKLSWAGETPQWNSPVTLVGVTLRWKLHQLFWKHQRTCLSLVDSRLLA